MLVHGAGRADRIVVPHARASAFWAGLDQSVWVCARVKELLANESNIARLSSPVTVVGDIHGCDDRRPSIFARALKRVGAIGCRQFYDLQELFRIAGHCPNTNFLFLVRVPALGGEPAGGHEQQNLWSY